jgi:hypothetical protein
MSQAQGVAAVLTKLISKIAAAPRESVYLSLALTLILCQLSAIGVLARSQIERAQARESSEHALRMAVTRCLQEGQGTRMDRCWAQASAETGWTLPEGSADGGAVADGLALLHMAWRQ